MIAFKHDVRVIFWTLSTWICSLILWLACKEILDCRKKTVLLIGLLGLKLWLGLLLSYAYIGDRRVLLWNLCLWKRWSILQIEAEDFPNPMVRVCDILLSPSRVRETRICVGPKYFVCKLSLHLI